MTAPYGLLVAWLVSSFGAMHAVSFVAHRGRLSALWPAAYAVSLVVPIWSAASTASVGVLLALQICGCGLLGWWRSTVGSLAETWAASMIAGLTGANYLVWLLSWVVTDLESPSGTTVVAAGGASVALAVVAVVADRKSRQQRPDAKTK